MQQQIIENYLSDSILSFRNAKKMAERAIDQVSDDEFFRQIDEESNSLAMIVKHIAGNARSRWTDFLTSDGEKPDRNRDTEFELDPAVSREELMRRWESGWNAVFGALEPLTAADLDRTVTIRGEPHSVMQAVLRQMRHYAYHVGQIVQLAKHFR